MKIIKYFKWYFSKDKRYILKPTKEHETYNKEHVEVSTLIRKGLCLKHTNRKFKQFKDVLKWVPDLDNEVKSQINLIRHQSPIIIVTDLEEYWQGRKPKPYKKFRDSCKEAIEELKLKNGPDSLSE